MCIQHENVLHLPVLSSVLTPHGHKPLGCVQWAPVTTSPSVSKQRWTPDTIDAWLHSGILSWRNPQQRRCIQLYPIVGQPCVSSSLTWICASDGTLRGWTSECTGDSARDNSRPFVVLCAAVCNLWLVQCWTKAILDSQIWAVSALRLLTVGQSSSSTFVPSN